MLFASEDFINRSTNTRYGESDVYETFADTPGELYRAMRREYGRCTGHVYVDGPDGSARAIGWVFVKRCQYDDCPETYLREAWITVYASKPVRSVTYDYATVG